MRLCHLWIRIGMVLALGAGLGGAARAADEDAIGLNTLKATGKAFAAVAKKATPAVVYVGVEKNVRAMRGPGGMFQGPMEFGPDFLERFFGQGMPFGNPRGSQPMPHGYPRQNRPFGRTPQGREPQFREMGAGSGFIVSSDGYVLTNNHNVAEADRVTLKLSDGREFVAKVVGTDPQTDVAVLKVEGKDLPYLELGESDALEVGEWVLAIGNPFGLSHTVTAGIVSAKGRSRIGILGRESYEDFIQTDAAINPGNSGGPLLNLEGKVVGMNTAIFSRSGGSMGIGFAIPIEMARSIQKQLVETGSVTRGFLGVLIQELTPELVASFNLKGKEGILVAEVSPGSPAEKAGVQQGDVIVEMAGEKVDDASRFRNRVAMTPPGTKLDFVVLRNGERKTLSAEVAKLDPEKAQVASAVGRTGSDRVEKFGFAVANLTPALAQQYGLAGDPGVVVVYVEEGSAAEMVGLQPGAVILQVGRTRVRNTVEFGQAMKAMGQGGNVALLVKQDGQTRYIGLRMEE